MSACTKRNLKVCVIGGGAAGMFAAVMLARRGADVTLLEKNEKLGKKLYITGKGRCNLTNDCTPDEFLENVVRGEKFMRSSIYAFPPEKTIAFFEDLGLNLVTERGNRVFPLSGKSNDVIKVLSDELKRLKVNVFLNTEVTKISKTANNAEKKYNSENGYDSNGNNCENGDKFENGNCNCAKDCDIGCKDNSVFYVTAGGKEIVCDNVFIATGGKSYPSTGSTGDGYAFAEAFGHGIVEPVQGLAPILVKENVSMLQGLSLKNIMLTAFSENGKLIKSVFGELMFTNRGLSGPSALTLSSYINRQNRVKLVLDLKPALDKDTLEKRILRDFGERVNQNLKNVTRALLPERLNLYVIAAARLKENKKVNSVTAAERAALVKNVKNLTFSVSGLAPFEEAVITSGGVDLKGLKPTFESKTIEGLYFIGETADIDALTGGYNLQIAFASAAKAAMSAIDEK